MAKLKDTNDAPGHRSGTGPQTDSGGFTIRLPSVDPRIAAVVSMMPDAPRITPAQAYGDLWNGAEPAGDPLPAVTQNPTPGPSLPLLQPNSPHWLVFNPARWCVLEGEVVPLLSKLMATPGANGVDRVGRKADMRTAFRALAEDGRFVIPHDIDGPGTSYVKSYLVGMTEDRRTGAPIRLLYWCDRWERVFPGSDVIESDTKAYAGWLRNLVLSGYFPPPSRTVLNKLEQQALWRLELMRKKWGDERHSSIKRYEADLAALTAERERVEALVRGGPPAATAGDAPDVVVP